MSVVSVGIAAVLLVDAWVSVVSVGIAAVLLVDAWVSVVSVGIAAVLLVDARCRAGQHQCVLGRQ